VNRSRSANEDPDWEEAKALSVMDTKVVINQATTPTKD
jgi:hypothetical protein